MAKMYRILGKRGRITIPYAIRQRIGFGYNDVLSFTESADGRSVVIRREKLCGTPSNAKPTGKDEITLFDFLNSLSPGQQRAALSHLYMKWAENKEGENHYGE